MRDRRAGARCCRLRAGEVVVDAQHVVALREQASHRCEPRKPAPPVTRIRLRVSVMREPWCSVRQRNVCGDPVWQASLSGIFWREASASARQGVPPPGVGARAEKEPDRGVVARGKPQRYPFWRTAVALEVQRPGPDLRISRPGGPFNCSRVTLEFVATPPGALRCPAIAGGPPMSDIPPLEARPPAWRRSGDGTETSRRHGELSRLRQAGRQGRADFRGDSGIGRAVAVGFAKEGAEWRFCISTRSRTPRRPSA